MKRYNFSVLIVFLIAGCFSHRSAAPEDRVSRRIEILLPDTMGRIKMLLPFRYDTSFYWIHYTDCGMPCAERKFRHQPKALRITKENGWYWFGEPKDSIDRFTVILPGIHTKRYDAPYDSTRYFYSREYVTHEFDFPILRDTFERVGDRNFSILVSKQFDTINHVRVFSNTYIKGEMVWFNFELLTKVNDSLVDQFIDRSFYYIRSIRVSNN